METPVLVGAIASVTTIGVGLIVHWVTRTWQDNRFREERQLKWVDDQLVKLYGPMSAKIFNATMSTIANDHITKEITNHPDDEFIKRHEQYVANIWFSEQIHVIVLLESIRNMIFENYQYATTDTIKMLRPALKALYSYNATVERSSPLHDQFEAKTSELNKHAQDLFDHIIVEMTRLTNEQHGATPRTKPKPREVVENIAEEFNIKIQRPTTGED